MHARVKPHPGQGTPVNLKNAHCQDGRCSVTNPMWRLSAPSSKNPNLRSRKTEDNGEKAVGDNIARAFYSRLPGITNYSFTIKLTTTNGRISWR